MNSLYPLKFYPIYKDKIWGGDKLQSYCKRTDIPSHMENSCGESWEISAVEENLSVVSNGFLAGNNIQELIEIYMDEVVGADVYEKFGVEFPLLFKFLDTTDRLSIQVHPGDDVAKERHHAWGKSELWYIVDAKDDAELIVGFNQDISKEMYLECIENKTFPKVLNYEKPKAGDVYYIPAGRLHAILEGFLIAEIQQTSDVTYRIYDWDRKDSDGKERELHSELAVGVLEYSKPKDGYKTKYEEAKGLVEIQETPFFTINKLALDSKQNFECLAVQEDKFVVYMCIEGEGEIIGSEFSPVSYKKGETVLIPAAVTGCEIHAKLNSILLEIYI